MSRSLELVNHVKEQKAPAAEQVEHAHGEAVTLEPPMREFTPEEDKKLYRKVILCSPHNDANV